MEEIHNLKTDMEALEDLIHRFNIRGANTSGLELSVSHIRNEIGRLSQSNIANTNSRYELYDDRIILDNHNVVYVTKTDRSNSAGIYTPHYYLYSNIYSGDITYLEDIMLNIERAASLYSNNYLNCQLHAYQLCVYGNNMWYSVRNVNDILSLLQEFSNKYDDTRDMLIEQIYIKYVTNRHPMLLNTVYPISHGSDRNIRYIGDSYVALTISYTCHCCSLAYTTWLYYINGLHLINRMSDIIKDSMYNVEYINSINDIRIIHKVIVCVDDESVMLLSKKDTIDNVCLFYSKEHVDLIIHVECISKNLDQYLRYYTKPCYTSIIHKRSIRNIICNINTLDLECIRYVSGDIIVHKPICTSYCINGYVDCFIGYNCISDFVHYITTNVASDITFWVHYGSGYDIHILVDNILPFCDKDMLNPVDLFDTNQSIISASFNLVNGYKLIIRDSYRMLLLGLGDLCLYFNVDNPKIPLNPTSFKKEDFKSKDSNAVIYAMTDSLSLYQVLHKYRDECLLYGLVDPLNYMTIASMSKSLFLSKFYDEKSMYICSLNRSAYDYIKRSYHGGITRVFKSGLFKGIYTYDIKSSYPYVATKKLPCGNPKWSWMNVLIDDINILPRYQCFIECFIIPPKTGIKYSIPIHLYRDSDGNDVDESIGVRYKQVLYYKEMRLGLKYGYKYFSKSILSFSASGYVLRSFNMQMYAHKHDADIENQSVKKHIYKTLMNSNYGSWGFNKYNKRCLRIYNDNDVAKQHCAFIEECGEGEYKNSGSYIFSVQNCNIDLTDTNIAIASSITSLARIRLFKLGKVIEDLGYNIYYCDTDSIKSDMIEIPNNKRFGKEFGQAYIEYDGWNNVECNIYQKKLFTSIYERDGEYKVAIVAKNLNIKKRIKEGSIILEDTTQDDLLQIHNDMKHCYIHNTYYERKESMIYTGRTNILNSRPMLYEKIINKSIKIR